MDQGYLLILAGHSCVFWRCFSVSLWCWCLVRCGSCSCLFYPPSQLKKIVSGNKHMSPSTSSPHPKFLARTRPCHFLHPSQYPNFLLPKIGDPPLLSSNTISKPCFQPTCSAQPVTTILFMHRHPPSHLLGWRVFISSAVRDPTLPSTSRFSRRAS